MADDTIGGPVSAVNAPRWAVLHMPEFTSPIGRTVVAVVVAVTVIIVVQTGIQPVLPGDQGAYLLSALAVLVSASVAGVWAGILTTVLLAFVAAYYWESPHHSFRVASWEDVAQIVLFLVIGASITALAERLRRARHRAENLAAREAEAKRAARESGEWFRRMLEQGPLGISIVGPDYRIRSVNRMFSQMIGYAPEELKGRTIESLTYPPDTAEDARLGSQMWAGLIPGYKRNKRYRRKDNSTFWATTSVAVIRDEQDRPVWAIGMVLDISEHKRLEEALERSKTDAEAASHAKDQFLAVLSHELRTPLSPVLLTTSSLEDHPALPDWLQDDIRMIRQNVELEARLIDDLLDLTGIARGKLVLHRMRTDAHALIGQALYMVERDIEEKRLRVQVDLTAPCDTLDADPTRLQQVFWNLIKNAVKFTPAGGEIRIRSSCTLETKPDGTVQDWLIVEVQDTGAGIAPEVMPRLFRAFEQGTAGVTRRYGGLGLGLAISRSIVEMHGGTISASSEGPGRGATFTVRLPMASADNAPDSRPTIPAAGHPLTQAAAKTPPPIDGRRRRILLVEDHPATRRAMAAILQSLGHEVRAAATLAEALALAETGTFDLVLSDLALPDGSGHDLMRQLKAKHPLHGVAISGYGMEDDIRRSREAGFDEHLTKPVSRDKIRDALSHVGT